MKWTLSPCADCGRNLEHIVGKQPIGGYICVRCKEIRGFRAEAAGVLWQLYPILCINLELRKERTKVIEKGVEKWRKENNSFSMYIHEANWNTNWNTNWKKEEVKP